MQLQRLLSFTRRAVDDYQMIQSGDRIAIGISGGKDSLTLLYALKGLKRFYPNSFEIEALTVDLGYENLNLDPIKKLCNQLDVNYTIIHTDIGRIIFEDRKEKNPCSLCAKMRKGAFNKKAKELGCNKIAYGHHKDDLVETMLLSLIYEGRFYSFSPVTYLDRMQLTLIRPLIYVNESDIIGFAHKYKLPVCKSPCPADGNTKREYAKKLAAQINRENPGAIDRMFTAILDENISGWPQRMQSQQQKIYAINKEAGQHNKEE